MNIWYIHPYSGSPKHGMSFRPYYLANHFNQLGHTTTVISSSFHHLCGSLSSEPGVIDVEGVNYYLQKSTTYSGNGIGRLINMFSFGFGLFSGMFRRFSIDNKPDVIIASTAHPFHLLASKYYAKKYGAKLILEVRDIWPLSLQELLGLSKYHPLNVVINIFQKFGYKSCDHCVSLLGNAENFFVKEGLPEGRFTYIPNGIELLDENSNKGEENNKVPLTFINELQRATANFDTVIGYTGALGVPNNMMPLIEAASELKKDNIGVLIVGDGAQKEELQARAKELSLNNVVFFGKVPKTLVATVIEHCDALFIGAQPTELYKYGISLNKMFDYMMHNKVVFNGIDSPGNPLEKAGCEVKFPADDALALSQEVIKFHRNKKSYTLNSSKFVKEHHSYKQLAKKYISLMESLVK